MDAYMPGCHFNNGRFTNGKPGELVFQASYYHFHRLKPEMSQWYFPLEVAYRLRKELDECIKVAEETAKEFAKSELVKLIDDLENEDE
jgi:hypothetical protein